MKNYPNLLIGACWYLFCQTAGPLYHNWFELSDLDLKRLRQR